MLNSLLATTTALFVGLSATASHEVSLRDGNEVVTGRITAVTDAGVTIDDQSGDVQVISWHQVRDIHGDDAPEHDAFLRRAEDLWRARTRLERGDAALAMPLFERWFETYRGQTNETALVAAEGLLRCCLTTGDHADGVIAGLEAARIRRAGVTTDAFSSLPYVIDPDTDLCVGLAPFWAPDRSLRLLASDLAAHDVKGDETIAALAHLYGLMLNDELSPDDMTEVKVLTRSDHPGIRLMAIITTAVRGDAAAKESARNVLNRQLSEAETWTAAWIHFALGASYLGDDQTDSKRRGLLHLAYLPARYGDEQPYLAGLALRYMSDTLAQMGDTDASNSLHRELERRYPAHPILAIEQITLVPDTTRDQT